MAKEWKPRRVTSEEDRGSGSSDYMQLEEGEKFLGYALFEADPSVEEPGYYEYMEHWVTGAHKSVPCAGEDCPICADGEKPKTRAKTLWLVTSNEKGTKLDPPQLRIFNFNWNLVNTFTEFRGEGEKIKGRQFRVSKTDAKKGAYTVIPKTEALKVAEVKEWLKNPSVPDFDSLVTSQLRKAMEGLVVARAMEDNDDDGDETPAATKSSGKAKPAAAKAKKKAEWPAEAEDLEVTVDETNVDESNIILVSHDDYDGQAKVFGTDAVDLTGLEDGSTVTLDWITDSDDDFVATSAVAAEAEAEAEEEPEADADEPDSPELPDKIVSEEFEVVSVDASSSTIEVKSDEMSLEFTLYFLDTMPIDFDDYEDGMTVIVTAEKDSDGDMVATEVPKKKAAAKGAKGSKSAPAKIKKG